MLLQISREHEVAVIVPVRALTIVVASRSVASFGEPRRVRDMLMGAVASPPECFCDRIPLDFEGPRRPADAVSIWRQERLQ